MSPFVGASTPAATMDVSALTDTQAVTLPPPTTIPNKVNDRYYRRRTADNDLPRSQWGVAAPAASSSFKSPAAAAANKPTAKCFKHHMSKEALARKHSSIKYAARFLSKPGLISLGGGLPTSAYFPFSSLSTTVPSGKPGEFDEASTELTGTVLHAGKHDLATGESIFDIATAYNYGQGTGSPQMLRWVTEHTELVHNPPYADWACNMTIGSTSALDVSLRLFCNRGEAVLTESYTFCAALESMVPMGLEVAGVPMDGEGMIPAELARVLEHWDPAARNGALRPRLIYLIPTGQNPTGATMPLERRKHIYAICQQYDVFILEDEPYYFLQMPAYTPGQPSPDDDMNMTHDAFLASLVPSFLSLDTDGRVLRMDSFAKVLSPGARMGWVTASQQVIDFYRMHVDVSTQSPSGLSQLVFYKLLDEHWGHGKFLDWLKYMRREYTLRRDALLDACERYMPREITRWVPPTAGMFFIVKVDWRQHPRAGTATADEIEEAIFMKVIEHNAMVIRGSWFLAEPNSAQGNDEMFFRATFAAAPLDQIDEAMRRFADALRDSFGLDKEQPQQNGVNGVAEH